MPEEDADLFIGYALILHIAPDRVANRGRIDASLQLGSLHESLHSLLDAAHGNAVIADQRARSGCLEPRLPGSGDAQDRPMFFGLLPTVRIEVDQSAGKVNLSGIGLQQSLGPRRRIDFADQETQQMLLDIVVKQQGNFGRRHVTPP
jgi:hypothetical protein